MGVRPRDLLDAAKHLADYDQGKPKQAYLRRAVSTTYYAMFHALARCCADLIIGGSRAERSKAAWTQVYRALEHGAAKNACLNKSIVAKFPQRVQDFANSLVTMQNKRHEADYHPNATVFKSAVLADIAAVELVIEQFEACPIKDRRAFAALVLFKQRF